MPIVDIINSMLKYFGIFGAGYFTFAKIINYKQFNAVKITISVISCIGIAFLSYVLRYYVSILMVLLLLCLLSSMILSKLTSTKLDVSITVMMISLGISFITFLISCAIIFFPMRWFKLDLGDIRIMFTTIIINLILIICFFKIRRFQNGFQFIHNNYISGLGIVFGGIALLIYTLLGNYRGDAFAAYMTLGAIICGIGIIIWVRKGIKIIYKQKLKERTIQQLEDIIREKDAEIKRYMEREKVVMSANHSVKARLAAAEMAVMQMANLVEGSNIVDMSEYTVISNFLQSISNDYESMINKLDHKKTLPSTKVASIDYILELMQRKAVAGDIDFNLSITGSINYMIEEMISKERLETLLGDHIDDAIIAINATPCVNRRIHVLLGELGDCYGLSIYDSGIEFEIDTLLFLGLNPITTHKEEGGSGTGFMTTFETMKECGASLIIKEKAPSATDFTKSVTICFDGKNQYVIQSYRADEIRSRSNADGRIVIEDS